MLLRHVQTIANRMGVVPSHHREGKREGADFVAESASSPSGNSGRHVSDEEDGFFTERDCGLLVRKALHGSEHSLQESRSQAATRSAVRSGIAQDRNRHLIGRARPPLPPTSHVKT